MNHINSTQAMEELIRANTGSNGIFNAIRNSIIDGQYSFNERLPSERDLAERYNAARGTVRSALELLEQAELVKRKFGSGTFVAYRSDLEQVDISEETSPLELIEARMAIEPHMVRLVILNASNRDLNRLEEVLTSAENTQGNPNEFSHADEAFHLMLANCSQNPLIIWIYKRINDIRSHNQWSARKNNILSPEKIDAYNSDHKQLMEAIRQRDQLKATDIIRAHLQQAKKDLIGSL